MERTRCPFTECRCNNTLCANAREADELAQMPPGYVLPPVEKYAALFALAVSA